MSWPEDYLQSVALPRLNPFPTNYLMPIKWQPIYDPPDPWEKIPSPPVFDEFANRVAPKPPDGAIIKWYKMPKDQWPWQANWGQKVFGSWPPSKIIMSEDLPPSIWPGGHRTPDFGFIKLMMPGVPSVSGNQQPKHHQLSFMHMRIRMLPDPYIWHNLKVKTRETPMGTKYYLQNENWGQYAVEYNVKEIRMAIKTMTHKEYLQWLAKKANNMEPKPSRDLFS
jgi:hypothetical protein